MAIQDLSLQLQNQQRKANEHQRHVLAWFNDHVIMITAGFFAGVTCLTYAGWKANAFKFPSDVLMNIGRLLMVWSLDNPLKLRAGRVDTN